MTPDRDPHPAPDRDDRCPVPGVREIDHTADLALEIDGPDLSTLFERAARGTVWLLFEEPPDGAESAGDAPGDAAGGPDVGDGERRSVSLSARDLPSLLRAWLREVVFWLETEGWMVQGLEVEAPLEDVDREDRASDDADRVHLGGSVRGRTTPRNPVREIKGVTRHALAVERRGDRWFARVIFDV